MASQRLNSVFSFLGQQLNIIPVRNLRITSHVQLNNSFYNLITMI